MTAPDASSGTRTTSDVAAVPAVNDWRTRSISRFAMTPLSWSGMTFVALLRTVIGASAFDASGVPAPFCCG